jgi:leader peptidase (prepilin peptidase) / N-methyltransferase
LPICRSGTETMSFDPQALLFPGLFLLLCALCGALALIDLRHGIIPDGLNLAIAGLGLASAIAADGGAGGAEAIGEAIAAGAICWLLRRLYFAWRKIHGLGLGDVKFVAAATMWVGFWGTPTLILIAALAALVAAGGLQIAGHQLTRRTSLPFGPFLALGLLATVALQQWLGAI